MNTIPANSQHALPGSKRSSPADIKNAANQLHPGHSTSDCRAAVDRPSCPLADAPELPAPAQGLASSLNDLRASNAQHGTHASPPVAAARPRLAGEAVQLRDDLLNRANKLFGEATVVQLCDERFPDVFQDSMKELKITGRDDHLIAASCGTGSNLCAIVAAINNPTMIKKILELNPWLHDTAWTTWRGLVFIWVRLEESWRPGNRALPGLLWIADGILPAVDIADATLYPRGFPVTHQGAAVLAVKFAGLNWSSEINELFLFEHMEALHGKLVQQAGPRKWVLNYMTAAAFLGEALFLAYDKNTDSFLMMPTGKSSPEPMSKIILYEAVSIWLKDQAVKYPRSFPVGDHVKRIVSGIKECFAIERPDERKGLDQYLNERLERRPGSSLTTGELFDDYAAYCQSTGLAAFPQCVFLDKLTKAIREKFGLTKVHNVMRHHGDLGRMTARYGFNGLHIKKTGSVEAKEPKEVAEGSFNQASEPCPRICANPA